MHKVMQQSDVLFFANELSMMAIGFFILNEKVTRFLCQPLNAECVNHAFG